MREAARLRPGRDGLALGPRLRPEAMVDGCGEERPAAAGRGGEAHEGYGIGPARDREDGRPIEVGPEKGRGLGRAEGCDGFGRGRYAPHLARFCSRSTPCFTLSAACGYLRSSSAKVAQA